MEEKWWKFLHYVQLDLEEENNFEADAALFPFYSLPSTLIFTRFLFSVDRSLRVRGCTPVLCSSRAA